MASSLLTRPAVWTAATAVVGLGIATSTYNHESHTAHADSPTGPKTVFPGSGFTTLKLESAEMVNHNVKRLRFALPEQDSITGLGPVSSLLTRHTPDGAWIPCFRPYTPVSDSDEPGHVTFMIKRYPNGKASGKMHSLVPGDEMKFKQLQEFKYTPNEFSAMTFIAGGSGITPIHQLTRAILKNPADKTKVTLVYANNSPEDILLRREFEALKSKYPGRFETTYVVSKENSDSEGLYQKGYVTKELLEKAMPDPKGEKAVKVLVSGPPPMTEAIAGAKGGFGWTQGNVGGALKELGYTKEQVFKF